MMQTRVRILNSLEASRFSSSLKLPITTTINVSCALYYENRKNFLRLKIMLASTMQAADRFSITNAESFVLMPISLYPWAEPIASH
ncbi:unnamed protein product [Cochlearia groenlandica]